MSNPENSSPKLVFSMIVGIPLLVIAFSTLLYQLANRDVVSLGTVNHGTLIQPPQSITELDPRHRNGEVYAFNKAESLWQFAVVGDGQCEQTCETMLYLIRQTHTALGKKMNRVGTMYISTENQYDAAFEQLLMNEHEKLTPLVVEGKALTSNALLPLQDEAMGFYVIDPKGWIMMVYQLPNLDQETLTSTGKLVLKDMKRLLR